MCSSVNVRGIDMSRCTDDSTDIAELGVFEGLPDEIPAFTRDVGVLQKRSVKCPSAARIVRVDERYVPASRKSSGGNETVQ